MGNSDFKNINTVARFSNFQVINKDFTRCRCNVFYTGRNRNYSDITQDALDKFVARKGYANVPVVAHLYKGEDGNYRVGGHDGKIIISNDGVEFVNECIPFGVVPEDCNPGMDLITERSGEKRKYFSVDVILWTHRYPIMEAAYGDEVYFNQSMEISFDSYRWDNDGYVVVDDFSMSALCLLNKSNKKEDNQEPCFESSTVKKYYALDSFKEEFSLMMNEYKKIKTNKEGNKSMDLEKLKNFLSEFTFEDKCGNTVEKYALCGEQTESTFTVVDKEDSYKVYSVDYGFDDDQNIVPDWDTKIEKKFALVSADTENAINLDSFVNDYAQFQINQITEELMAPYNAKLDEMIKEYENVNHELDEANKKLSAFEAKEAEAKKNAHIQEINDIVNEFAKKLSRNPKFLVYKAKLNPEEATVEQVTQDLTLMVGKEIVSGKNANFNYQPREARVTDDKNKDVTSRYGHLLDKYMK